jgi:hypothetical protein
MSRLRIIRDGAYSWLDEGPSNGANGPARVSGSLALPPPTRQAKARTYEPLHAVRLCDLAHRCRHAPCVSARAAEARRLFQTTDLSLKQIGELLGGRDHSTVSYWLREFSEGAA